MSNDQLRDHTYAMLATRTFTKFKQAHLVKYKFNYLLNEEKGFDPVPVVERPPVYVVSFFFHLIRGLTYATHNSIVSQVLETNSEDRERISLSLK